jgi:hypothetical protein
LGARLLGYMANKTKVATGDGKGFRIHPSRYVLEQLSELAEKGQLATSVPEIARILLGERLMQLEKEGLVSPGTRGDNKEK